jgi:hypothetical protein
MSATAPPLSSRRRVEGRSAFQLSANRVGSPPAARCESRAGLGLRHRVDSPRADRLGHRSDRRHVLGGGLCAPTTNRAVRAWVLRRHGSRARLAQSRGVQCSRFHLAALSPCLPFAQALVGGSGRGTRRDRRRRGRCGHPDRPQVVLDPGLDRQAGTARQGTSSVRMFRGGMGVTEMLGHDGPCAARSIGPAGGRPVDPGGARALSPAYPLMSTA